MKRVGFAVPVILSLLLFFSMRSHAFAAGFDPVFYAERYPDVVAELGTDPDRLYQHYLTYGQYEGRSQNADEEREKQRNGGTVQAAPPAGKTMAGYSTYVDINIETQTVTYVENGVDRLVTPCVTGNAGRGMSTPKGVFAVKGKATNTYLTGPTWRSYVQRWMPFKGGCGLHDASWRSEFGGEIYKTSGSHGCVNLPHDAALQLYDMVVVGTPVIVH